MGETDKYKYLKLNLQFLFIEKCKKKKYNDKSQTWS